MSAEAFCIGLDLGTSSLKVVAVDDTGRVRGRAQRPYPTHRPEPGAAEQSPHDWWRAVVDGLGELSTQVPARQWRAIGLSAMLPTLVAADDAGTSLGAAITWQDGRAEAEGAALRAESGGGESLYERTGQWVDGRYLLPMMARQQTVDAAARGATRILGAKDYLFGLLTGQVLTDPSTAAGYGCYDLHRGAWSSTVPWQLPEVVPSTTTMALAREHADRWGLRRALPVVVGAADSVLGAYALGVHDPGQVAYLAGSSTVILGVVDGLRLDAERRYLLTPVVTAGAAVEGSGAAGTAASRYGAEMDLLATGSAAQWWGRMLGLSGPDAWAELADTAVPGAGPVFLPYLAPGEQGALWDPELAGAVVGLTLHHTRADLARSLRTGIVLESARCVAVLDQVAADATPREIRLGGGAGSGLAQDLADATGRPVHVDRTADTLSAVGAAWLAAQASGVAEGPLPSPEADTPEAMPRTQRADQWRELFDRHEQARAAFGEWSRTQEPKG